MVLENECLAGTRVSDKVSLGQEAEQSPVVLQVIPVGPRVLHAISFLGFPQSLWQNAATTLHSEQQDSNGDANHAGHRINWGQRQHSNLY